MARCVWPHAALAALLLVLAGCSNPIERAQRPAWRAQADKACMAEGKVHMSRYVALRGREIDGPGICGLTEPLLVGALAEDSVQIDTVATLDCPMTAALNAWITDVVQPDAMTRFGQKIAQVDTMGSYACRGMNGQAGARISEHAFGNALDIAGFRLADGRRITVVRDWTQGDDQAQAFLRDVHAGACNTFTTVLGPGSNAFHYNHIHVDLAIHGGSSRGLRHVCKPVPEASRPGPSQLAPPSDGLPEAPLIEEDQDVASTRVPYGGRAEPGLVASAPAAMEPGWRYNHTQPRPVAAAAPPAGGSYRDDGAYEPEGNPHDWDVTSSIRQR